MAPPWKIWRKIGVPALCAASTTGRQLSICSRVAMPGWLL